MTPLSFAYGIVLAGLLGAAAFFLDRSLRRLGRPARWIWLGAMWASVTGPFIPRLFPAPAEGLTAAAGTLPQDLLSRLAIMGTENASGVGLLLETLGRIIPGVWLGASLLLGGVVLLTALRLWRAGRRLSARTLRGEEVFLSRDLGPAVLGLLRPRIVLPGWILTLEDGAVEMVLLHEKEHLQARDPVLLAMGTLAVLASPLNPALWWMFSRLRLAVEGDCDGRVLARGIPRKSYASLLLTVASRAKGSFSLAPALSEGGTTSLERRLNMMQWNVRESRVRGTVGGIVMGGFFLVLACETPVPSDPAVQAQETFQAGQVSKLTADTLRVLENKSVAGGKVSVRMKSGTGQVTGEKPLIIIDGVVASGSAGFPDIPAESIERIEVIKGAEALELYGEQGANGVIKIFTKGG